MADDFFRTSNLFVLAEMDQLTGCILAEPIMTSSTPEHAGSNIVTKECVLAVRARPVTD